MHDTIQLILQIETQFLKSARNEHIKIEWNAKLEFK